MEVDWKFLEIHRRCLEFAWKFIVTVWKLTGNLTKLFGSCLEIYNTCSEIHWWCLEVVWKLIKIVSKLFVSYLENIQNDTVWQLFGNSPIKLFGSWSKVSENSWKMFGICLEIYFYCVKVVWYLPKQYENCLQIPRWCLEVVWKFIKIVHLELILKLFKTVWKLFGNVLLLCGSWLEI